MPAGWLWLHAHVFDVGCSTPHVAEQLSGPPRLLPRSMSMAGNTISDTETSMSMSSSSVP